jgi:mono/diheme cytochrome c family protein
MFRSRYALAALLSALLFSGAAAADAKRGATIAKRWCAACHVVTSDQKSGSADVPSFADIARRSVDAKALAAFLMDPHPRMPDMHLSRTEIDAIVTYIRSLNPKTPPPVRDGKDVKLQEKG